MGKAEIFPEENLVLAGILRRQGWTAYDREESMSIVSQLQDMQTALAAEPAPPTATEISDAVVKALPTPPDFTAAMAAITAELDGMKAGDVLTDAQLVAIKAGVDLANTTLGSPVQPAP